DPERGQSARGGWSQPDAAPGAEAGRRGGHCASVGAVTAAALDPPSFWLADVGEPLVPRPPLEGERAVDVAIVGAGYTGLWTAWYLATQDPGLAIAIVEREVAGFGAAGRNGGWCSLHHAGVTGWLRSPQRAGAIALQRAMFDAVDEVGRVAAAEGIACDYAKA